MDAMTWALEIQGVGPIEKLVLIMLARDSTPPQYSNAAGAFVTIQFPLFADECCLDEITAAQTLSHLELNNFIERASYKNRRYEYILKFAISVTSEKNKCDILPGYQPGEKLNPILYTSERLDSATKNQSLARTSSEKNHSQHSEYSASVCILIPLNTGDEFPITRYQIENWCELFPAVDVDQELRNYKAWILANPTKRKTKRGILKSIVFWLSKVQDRGGNRGPQSPTKTGFARTMSALDEYERKHSPRVLDGQAVEADD